MCGSVLVRTRPDGASQCPSSPGAACFKAARPGDGGLRRGIPARQRAPRARRRPAQGGSLRDIKHVVILMQENRTFDHYFGTLPEVRGFADPKAITLWTASPSSTSPTRQPRRLPAAIPPGHARRPARRPSRRPVTPGRPALRLEQRRDGQLAARAPGRGRRQRALHDGLPGARRHPVPLRAGGELHYLRQLLLLVLGPTWPNRLTHVRLDRPGRRARRPDISTSTRRRTCWQTYPEALTAAGVSWQVYQEVDNYECNLLEMFNPSRRLRSPPPLYQNGLRFSPAASSSTTRSTTSCRPSRGSSRPATSPSTRTTPPPRARTSWPARSTRSRPTPRSGRRPSSSSSTTRTTASSTTCAPPTAPGRDRAGEYVDGLPIGGRFRVPCIIISPWTQGGWIASETFDHTSVLRFLETLTGVTIPNITPWRRATFGDLTSAFGASPAGGFPHLPDTKSELAHAVYEVTPCPPRCSPPPARHPRAADRSPSPSARRRVSARTQIRRSTMSAENGVPER